MHKISNFKNIYTYKTYSSCAKMACIRSKDRKSTDSNEDLYGVVRAPDSHKTIVQVI